MMLTFIQNRQLVSNSYANLDGTIIFQLNHALVINLTMKSNGQLKVTVLQFTTLLNSQGPQGKIGSK